jgi:hypothetical protein
MDPASTSTLAPSSMRSNASGHACPIVPWSTTSSETSICASRIQPQSRTTVAGASNVIVNRSQAPSHDNSPPQEVSHPTQKELLDLWQKMNKHPSPNGAPVAQTCQEATTLWKSLRWFLLECAKGTGFMLIGCIATASTGLSAWTFSRLAQTLQKCGLDVDISNWGGTSYRVHVVRTAPVEDRCPLLERLEARRNQLDTSQSAPGSWTNVNLVQTVNGKQTIVFLAPVRSQGGDEDLPLMYCPVGVMQAHPPEYPSDLFPAPGHQRSPDPETGDSKNDSSDLEWEDVGSEDGWRDEEEKRMIE